MSESSEDSSQDKIVEVRKIADGYLQMSTSEDIVSNDNYHDVDSSIWRLQEAGIDNPKVFEIELRIGVDTFIRRSLPFRSDGNIAHFQHATMWVEDAYERVKSKIHDEKLREVCEEIAKLGQMHSDEKHARYSMVDEEELTEEEKRQKLETRQEIERAVLNFLDKYADEYMLSEDDKARMFAEISRLIIETIWND